MINVGAYLYLWSEVRYLPLVLEQLYLFPCDDVVILWIDKPFNWFSNKPRPSGWKSGVGEILAKFPHVRVIKKDYVISNNNAENFCSRFLKSAGVDVTFMFATDQLFDLPILASCIKEVENADKPKCFNAAARHYWRDWGHIYADSNILLARPTDLDVFIPDGTPMTTVSGMCHHPSYVFSDDEMYRKSCSWGHADLYAERKFYENEWIGRNDANWKARPVDVELPQGLKDRLTKWKAWLQ